MKVSALLESLPGVGKVRAKQIMERLASRNPAVCAVSAPTSAPRLSESSVRYLHAAGGLVPPAPRSRARCIRG